ncbi:hypothetical protein QSV08_12575 [Maribacter sp. BPC-D8]|uniref:hypothetical protein n=1 Tax=Maribacter sp. BPC-D8 TaxID=3053613 RepID=UPI002B4A58B8|nr:hypothetical protein [Maribacter sp. BPC-D8]WRI28060.1 hypothetical protein QSV08_12575 [Maribacter sp. BPC-D8]
MSTQFGNAQEQNSYDSLWDKVLDSEMENLSKSALKQAEAIFQKAKNEKMKCRP